MAFLFGVANVKVARKEKNLFIHLNLLRKTINSPVHTFGKDFVV